MKCNRCEKDAVTFHGISMVTHGYCEEHRCCKVCGLGIKFCECKFPTERPEYLEWLNSNRKFEPDKNFSGFFNKLS